MGSQLTQWWWQHLSKNSGGVDIYICIRGYSKNSGRRFDSQLLIGLQHACSQGTSTECGNVLAILMERRMKKKNHWEKHLTAFRIKASSQMTNRQIEAVCQTQWQRQFPTPIPCNPRQLQPSVSFVIPLLNLPTQGWFLPGSISIQGWKWSMSLLQNSQLMYEWQNLGSVSPDQGSGHRAANVRLPPCRYVLWHLSHWYLIYCMLVNDKYWNL